MKLITYDLERPAPTVPPVTAGEQWVLVRFHRRPLGMLCLEGGRAYSSAELKHLAVVRFTPELLTHAAEDALHRGEPPGTALALDQPCPQLSETGPLPSMTVAVCTRGGAAHIRECLDALAALDYAGDLEILVVDNAPADDSTARVVEAYPRLRYIVEPRPGLDWARNRAVLEARHDIVAFTDDDVSVDRWWADALGRLFAAEPDVMAATGLVVADEIDTEAQRLFEKYGGFCRGFRRTYHKVDAVSGERAATRHGGAGRFGTGANMAFRREVFARIGLFDPALDVGTPANGGGDLEMFFRVLKEGGTLVYEPAAMVRHRHRREYEQLRTQIANNGIGFYAYLVRSARAYPDERGAILKLGLWWLWWWNLRRALHSLVRRPAIPRALILAELRGSIIGLRRYAAASRRAQDVLSRFGPQRPHGEGGALA